MAHDKVDAISSAPAADDLLSQMAGDEIDRLLAEAENDHTPPPAEQPARVEPAPIAAAQTSAAQSTASVAAPSPGNAPSETASAPESRLDDLLREGEQTPPPIETTPPAPVISSDDGGVSPAAGEVAVRPVVAKLPAAPTPQPTAPVKKEAASSAAESVPANGAPRGDPLLVRILEVLNSPLDHVDDAVRQTIGWIAIVTLFNAIVVLAYVHFMRRR